MPQILGKKVKKVLLKNGFKIVRQSGSHIIFEHPTDGSTVTVPIHGDNNPIYMGVFMEIIKQSKISKKEFFKK